MPRQETACTATGFRLARPWPGFARLLTLCLASILGGCGFANSGPTRGPAPQSVVDEPLPAPADHRVETWVEDLEAPWSLVFLPDGRALVSERAGRIRLIRDGALLKASYATLETVEGGIGSLSGGVLDLLVGGEGDLMGLALHPDFPREPYVYAMHTYETTDGTAANRIIRLTDRGDRGVFDRIVFDGIPAWVFHNGGCLAFGPDGMLYATTGEIFSSSLAQDPNSLAGKVLRLAPDGGIPDDNPFPGSPVYSLGHRNSQGLAWHPETGDLFASEHGPSGEFGLNAHDEINVIRPGGNYGWPLTLGAPGRAGLVDPVLAWTGETTPPAGMAFHRGALYVAVLGEGALIRISLEVAGDTYRATCIERLFDKRFPQSALGRIRDVVSGPDGRLYLLTSNRDGRGEPNPGDERILRLTPRP